MEMSLRVVDEAGEEEDVEVGEDQKFQKTKCRSLQLILCEKFRNLFDECPVKAKLNREMEKIEK